MKKLLSMLGVLGLTTTASIPVVACGKADSETSLQSNEDLLEQQLENLQGLINDAFSKQLTSKNDLVQTYGDIDETADNDYFNIDDLKKQIELNGGITNAEGHVTFEITDNNDLQNANSDLQKLFGYADFVLNVQNSLNDDFSLVTSGINQVVTDMQMLNEITISWNSNLSQVTVNTTVVVKYAYSDINKVPQEGSLDFDLSYNAISNDLIANSITTVQTTLKDKLYEDKSFVFTGEDLEGGSTNPFLGNGLGFNFDTNSDLYTSIEDKATTIMKDELSRDNNTLTLKSNSDISLQFNSTNNGFYLEGRYADYDLGNLFTDHSSFKDDFKNTVTYKDSIDAFANYSQDSINSFLESNQFKDDNINKEVSDTGLLWGNLIVSGLSFSYDGVTIKVNNVSVPVVYAVSNESFENLINNDELKQLYEKNLTDSTDKYDNVKRSDWGYVVANDILKISDVLEMDSQDNADYFLQIQQNSEDENDFWTLLEDDPTMGNFSKVIFNSTQGSSLLDAIGVNHAAPTSKAYENQFWAAIRGTVFSENINKTLTIDDEGILSTTESTSEKIVGFGFSFGGLIVYIYSNSITHLIVKK